MPTDFFVSYTGSDNQWAEWIAFALEEAGFTTFIQAWDFRPGSNFVLEMQKAATTAERTILVLSPDYVQSQFAASEWAAAFKHDPKGLDNKLVPVRIAPVSAPGLLASIVYIDLVGLDQDAARAALLQGVNRKRAKPTNSPTFPGAAGPSPTPKAFPGSATTTAAPAPVQAAHMPTITRPASDADKRQLLRKAMEVIRGHFRNALAHMESTSQGVTSDLEEVSSREFFAEIFVDGKSKSRCRVFQGGHMSENSINYAEGSAASQGNASNETLNVDANGGDVFLKSLMGSVAFGLKLDDLNLQQLSPEDAAEYLWRRFTQRLT